MVQLLPGWVSVDHIEKHVGSLCPIWSGKSLGVEKGIKGLLGVIRWGLATPPDYKQPFKIWWGHETLVPRAAQLGAGLKNVT